MEIRVISDIHEGIPKKFFMEGDHTRICVAAGDLGDTILEAFPKLIDLSRKFKYVIYVPGNHEFSGKGGLSPNYYDSIGGNGMPCFSQLTIAATCLNEMENIPNNVIMLYNGTIEISNIRFIGTTLWTPMTCVTEKTFKRNFMNMPEYSGYISSNGFTKNIYEEFSEYHTVAPKTMLDVYDLDIDNMEMAYDSEGLRLLHYTDIQEMHARAKGFLKTELAYKFEGKTVVVTHHPPSDIFMDPKYKNSSMNASFYAECDELITEDMGIDTWIFGHTHRYENSHTNGINFLSNPVGYKGENTNFSRNEIIDIS